MPFVKFEGRTMSQMEFAQLQRRRQQEAQQREADLALAPYRLQASAALQRQREAFEQQQQLQAAQFGQQRFAQRQGFMAGLIGEEGRGLALGETEEARAKLSGLIKQGGALSAQQVAQQARRTTGQARQEIAGQESTLAGQFASRGIVNPAAVASATAPGRGQLLGLGSRIQSEGERQRAQSLVGILGQAGQLGQARAGLQAQTSYEDYRRRGLEEGLREQDPKSQLRRGSWESPGTFQQRLWAGRQRRRQEELGGLQGRTYPQE